MIGLMDMTKPQVNLNKDTRNTLDLRNDVAIPMSKEYRIPPTVLRCASSLSKYLKPQLFLVVWHAARRTPTKSREMRGHIPCNT